MAILRPTSQVSNLGWSLTGGANYADILSDESDASYLSAPNLVGGEAEVLLETGVDPGVDTGFTVHARGQYITQASDLSIALKQGGSVIAFDLLPLPSSFGEISFALTEGEAANITDFSDLRILIETGGGVSAGTLRVSEVWLEIPDDEPPILTTNGETGVMQARPTMPGEFQGRSGEVFPLTRVMKGDVPISRDDAIGGQICQVSGLWFPKRRIVWIDNLPYADTYAFDIQRHPSYYPLPRKDAP